MLRGLGRAGRWMDAPLLLPFKRTDSASLGNRKTLAMIQAHLDESGIHDGAGVCTIAGYFGGPGQWKDLGGDWVRIIKHYRVPEFHAKQFWGRTPEGGRVGPYRGWSDSKADTFLDQLVSTIESCEKLHPISSTVVMESFKKLSHNQRRFLTGAELVNGKFRGTGCPSKPYFLPFQICITDAADHAPVGGRAHFFFDFNKQFKGYALDLFALLKKQDIEVKSRIGDIDFPTGLQAPQLQAADLFCYQSYQFALKRAVNPTEKPSPLVRRLVRGTLLQADTFLDDKGLSLLLKDADIPPDS
jgi:hypothetical protein